MSAAAIHYAQAVLNDPDTSLGAPARAVLLQLAVHADSSGTAWPGNGRLARLTGLAERTIRRAAAELSRSGLVRLDQRSGRATVWTFPVALTPVTVTGVDNTRAPVTVTGVDNARPRSHSPRPRSQSPGTPVTESPIKRMEVSRERADDVDEQLGPKLDRCPERSSWRLCPPSCPSCHGSGHVTAM